MNININFITDVVIAACILHNYCINRNDIDIDEYHIDDNCNHDIVDNENVDNRFRMDRRTILFNELFS